MAERQYTVTMVICPTCGEKVPLYRSRIATHGWPTCAGTGEQPPEESS